MSAAAAPLLATALRDLHVAKGARMVPFAGYAMPVQYPTGILAEHRHTRALAGLFDVSHMGQITLRGANVAAALERLVPADIQGLPQGHVRYTQFTNADGGILDDLMVTNRGDHLFLVVNAACKAADLAHLQSGLPAGILVEMLADRALLALQGPASAAVLDRLAPGMARLRFMASGSAHLAGAPVEISRSGYTGEDGFEISVSSAAANALALRLLQEVEVALIGLGARDSLRLEAGLCLYGHDIDTTTTPIEAGLAWSIQPRRRQAGGFPGDAIIRHQLTAGAPRRRVGLLPEGRAPAREGTAITDTGGQPLGTVTSGGFGATVGGPVAMGYVVAAHATMGTTVHLPVRGKPLAARIARLPFVPHRYVRG